MSDPKRQHFVPRFYLRRFAGPGGRLQVLDKQLLRTFPASLNDVACQKNFYDLHQMVRKPGTDAKVVEKVLGDLEGRFSTALGDLIACLERGECPSERTQVEIACAVALQALRTDEHRRQIIEMTEMMQESLIDLQVPEDEVGKYFAEVPSVAEAAYHAKCVFGSGILEELSTVLHSHIWLFGRNISPLSFYTSDHPVARRAHIDGGGLMSYFGFGSPGIEVSFPLTPLWCLSMYERSFHGKHVNLDRKIMLIPEECVIYCNHLQVQASTRQVFSSRADLAFAERVCRERPQVRDVDRTRCQVVGGRRPRWRPTEETK